MITHYTAPYLLHPQHQVSIDLVGLGGTGSQMIAGLARINEALMVTGHPGLHVRSWDNDKVTESNIARQLFSRSDLGLNKAAVLTTRINRFFGYEWESKAKWYTGNDTSNITITCVDTAAARVQIAEALCKQPKYEVHAADKKYYWLDLGNLQKTGQAVLGTVFPIKQPKQKSVTESIPHIVKLIPEIKKIKESNQGPSCSLAEALSKQDLFINSTLAQFGCNLIWKLFREGMIRYHGCYLNLDSFIVNPIKIQ